MKRYKYGLNYQVAQTANSFDLNCIGITEVAPGDTLGGKFTARIISESTTKALQNRVYQDVFAFYVPYRLVWDDWPKWIAGDDTVTIPNVTALSNSYNMCLVKPTYAPLNTLSALPFRAYNLIWNKFFRDQSKPEVDLDNMGVQRTPFRKTTWIRRLKDSDQLTDTVAASLGVGDIREAFAQDRFNKTRAYYGDKYTDYLAALGVEASWSILDEPELVGHSNKALRYGTTDSTYTNDLAAGGNNQYTGATGGHWSGSNTCSIRRTFAPEHGMLMLYSTIRVDAPPENLQALPLHQKRFREEFYSPEFETNRKYQWSDVFLGQTSQMFAEVFDDYRVGQGIFNRTDTANPTWVSGPDMPADTTQDDINYYNKDFLDPVLNNQYNSVQFNVMNDVRMTRVSPIRPAQSVHGVS